MHEVLVNRLGGLSLPRKSVVRLTDRPDMTLDVYRGRKTTIQYNNNTYLLIGENRKDTTIIPPDLVLRLIIISSNYPCLKQIGMVPKVFEPLKFYYSCLHFSLLSIGVLGALLNDCTYIVIFI